MLARLRLLLRLSHAHARRHRTRTLLTVGGVALGVAGVTAVLALSRSITAAFEQSIVRGAGAAQLQVSNGSAGVARDLIDTLAATPGVVGAEPTVGEPELIRKPGGEEGDEATGDKKKDEKKKDDKK